MDKLNQVLDSVSLSVTRPNSLFVLICLWDLLAVTSFSKSATLLLCGVFTVMHLYQPCNYKNNIWNINPCAIHQQHSKTGFSGPLSRVNTWTSLVFSSVSDRGRGLTQRCGFKQQFCLEQWNHLAHNTEYWVLLTKQGKKRSDETGDGSHRDWPVTRCVWGGGATASLQ